MTNTEHEAPRSGATPLLRRRIRDRWLAALTVAMVLAGRAAGGAPSIARIWDEEILAAIRLDLPHPPAHARNLFHLSVAMYDAWAAYDPVAVGYLYREKHRATDVATARREAISFAAYRLLRERYALSRNAGITLSALDARLAELGYDKTQISVDPVLPAGVGNRVAAAVSLFFLEDGALQTRGYQDLPADLGGYVSHNAPLSVSGTVPTTTDVGHWQPLSITIAFTQNGLPIPSIQAYVGAQWTAVRPFALVRERPDELWIDPGPPPRPGGSTEEQFKQELVDVLRRSSELTPEDGVVIDISPGSLGNNPLGANSGTGRPLNPVTGRAYAPNLVKRGDFARVLAEFWADGPSSETPPGHWNVVANGVTDYPGFVRRMGGTGPVLDDLEWDVKMYFVLNAAVHDAACAAWSVKRYYDGWRPITAIRNLGYRGQSSDPNAPSYDPGGLPLTPGLIELVTAATAQPGARHAGLTPGTIAVFAWGGPPANPSSQIAGVKWQPAASWVPYQKKTFVTPAFPGYISGHSTFSRAGAEVLAAITGSEFFPGGLGTFDFPERTFLAFEMGPSTPVQLQWATYFDASDQAGRSRLWGGIHPSVDDLPGRVIGAQCGRGAWALARQYFDGSIVASPAVLSIRSVDDGRCEIRCQTLRGFYYTLQFTTQLGEPFQNHPSGALQAVDSSSVHLDEVTGPGRFYRIVREPLR